MRHPSNRAERRYARELARNRRRKHIVIHQSFSIDPTENSGWNRGGKQYIAHGNRCLHSLVDRHERRRQIKQSRRWRVDTSQASDAPVVPGLPETPLNQTSKSFVSSPPRP